MSKKGGGKRIVSELILQFYDDSKRLKILFFLSKALNFIINNIDINDNP